MFDTYDIQKLIQFRLDDQPKTHPIPAETDYWCKLLMKGHEAPKEMTMGEVFELGVYVERMFQSSNDDVFTLQHVIPYRRRLNGIFGR